MLAWNGQLLRRRIAAALPNTCIPQIRVVEYIQMHSTTTKHVFFVVKSDERSYI